MAEFDDGCKNFNNLNEKLLNNNIKLFHIFNYNYISKDKNIILVTNNDKVHCFGNNENGLLGFGHQIEIKDFTINEKLSDKQIIDFKDSENHLIARTISGNIYCWGKNVYGSLGNGSEDGSGKAYKPELNKYLLNENIIDISCGNCHTLVLTSNGELFSWGYNNKGQIGNNSNEKYVSIPFKLNAFSGEKIKSISCGLIHSTVLTENGHVFSWGNNYSGEFRIGNKDLFSSSPKMIKLDENITIDKISCSASLSLLLSREKNIYMFGFNHHNLLGTDTDFDEQIIPIKLINDNKFIEIASHHNYGILGALSELGCYYVWGFHETIEGVIMEPEGTQFKSFQELFDHYFEIIPKNALDSTGKYNKFYSNESKLGGGSYGTVFKAKHTMKNEYFAIKKIKLQETSADHLNKEMSLAFDSMLNIMHEFLVSYCDIWFERDFKLKNGLREWTENYKFYIQMELCDKSLSEFSEELKDITELYSNGLFTRLGYYLLSTVFNEILFGVKFLQENNIIHRDLNPDNILLKNGKIKIADFGLAKVNDIKRDPSIRNSGNIGKIKYVASEVNNCEDYDTKADIYSLGIILKEMFEIEDDKSIKYTNDEILRNKYKILEKLQIRMTNTKPNKRPDCKQILGERKTWCLSERIINPLVGCNFPSNLANSYIGNMIKFKNIEKSDYYQSFYRLGKELSNTWKLYR